MIQKLMEKTKHKDFSEISNLLKESVASVAPSIVCRVEFCNQLVFEEAYGFSDENCQIETNPSSLFDLASITKVFTACAFLKLVEKKLVSFEDKVFKFVPEFNGIKKVVESYDPLNPSNEFVGEKDSTSITFKELLSHCSGLPASGPFLQNCGQFPPSILCSEEEIKDRQIKALQVLNSIPFLSTQVYSDVGFILLGFAVSKIYNHPLEKCIHDLVIQPLQLDVHFNPLKHTSNQNRVVATEFCKWRKRRLYGEVHDSKAAALGGISGHAGLFGTAADVTKLASCFLYPNTNQQTWIQDLSLLQQSITEHVILSDKSRRGLGWELRNDSNVSVQTEYKFSHSTFGHTGFTGTAVWCDPQRNLVICLLTNRVYNGRDPVGITNLRNQVYSYFLNLFPIIPSTIPLSPSNFPIIISSPIQFVQLFSDLRKKKSQFPFSNQFKVQGLCGRVHKGLKDFVYLSDEPGKILTWLIDSEGLEKIVTIDNDLDILFFLGFDMNWIKKKLSLGYQFKLSIFPEKESILATWDNIFQLLQKHFPEAWPFVAPYQNELKNFNLQTIQANFKEFDIEEIDLKGREEEDFMTLERYLKRAPSANTLGLTRAFLYHEVGLSKLFGGNGYTLLNTGELGTREFLMPNKKINEIPELQSLPLTIICTTD